MLDETEPTFFLCSIFMTSIASFIHGPLPESFASMWIHEYNRDAKRYE